MQFIQSCNTINCETGNQGEHIHCTYPDCNKIIYKHVMYRCCDDFDDDPRYSFLDYKQGNVAYYDYHIHCNFVKPNGEKCNKTDFHSHCLFPNCTDENSIHRHCLEKTNDIACELTAEHIHCKQCDYVGINYNHVHCDKCNLTVYHSHCNINGCNEVSSPNHFHCQYPDCNVFDRQHSHCNVNTCPDNLNEDGHLHCEKCDLRNPPFNHKHCKKCICLYATPI